MLLKTERRTFLSGVAALLAAPALVRVQSIMPISPTETYRLGGILTWQQIADEAARILRRNLSRRTDVAGWGNAVPGGRNNQYHVDLGMSLVDITLPIQTFAARYLEPAMAGLADAIPSMTRVAANAIQVPDGISAGAISEGRGLGLRFVRDYDVRNDRVLTRLDVRSVA